MASENPVNNTYKHFILKVLTPTDWESADRRDENLLAKAIYTLVAEKKGHKGFYFPDSQYDNTFTEEKLEKSLLDSHVFVQMVQNVMFRPPSDSDRKNYCHFEFIRAYGQLETEHQVEHRMLFMIAERKDAFIRPRDVYPPYEPWLDQIIRRRMYPIFPRFRSRLMPTPATSKSKP